MSSVGDEYETGVDRIATGGEGVATAPDGRIVFVAGGLPGDRVRVRVTDDRTRFQRAEISAIVVGSGDRRLPPCRHVADGCGGCDWQHVEPAGQAKLRAEIVGETLRRLGHIEGIPIQAGPPLPSEGYRTVIRAGVRDGRAGFRASSSHRLVIPDSCLTAHPQAEELLVEGRFPGASEVVIKVGARTGERLAVVTPAAHGVSVPADVVVIGRDELGAGRSAHLHEEVGGHRFRISADSFFQCRPDGAEALVDAARDMVRDAPDGALLDAYCGVGLFGALLGGGRRVIGVESSASSVSDARHNLPASAEVHRADVGRWPPQPVGVVVADPSRRGLGRAGVETLIATGASRLVLVSCDPAALARDARLLIDTGFSLDEVRVFDLFGNTSHIETVSSFRR